jgi:hypothetical protein
MRRLIAIISLAAFLTVVPSCRRIGDDDLVGGFTFEKDTLRLTLQLNRNHTFSEEVADVSGKHQSTGVWRYWDGPQNLSLDEVWVPFVPLGSQRIQLRRGQFTFHVNRCGSKLCLGISDNDPPLSFMGDSSPR